MGLGGASDASQEIHRASGLQISALDTSGYRTVSIGDSALIELPGDTFEESPSNLPKNHTSQESLALARDTSEEKKLERRLITR